jgi:hypothetical protein
VDEANNAFDLNTALFSAIQTTPVTGVESSNEVLPKGTNAISQVATAMLARTSYISTVSNQNLTLAVYSLPGSFNACRRQRIHRYHRLLGPPHPSEFSLRAFGMKMNRHVYLTYRYLTTSICTSIVYP